MRERKRVIEIPEGKICDYIDGVFRKDTPEEYVRQTIEKRLINEHKYKFGQVGVEKPIKIGSSNKRVDLAIWQKNFEGSKEEINKKRKAVSQSDIKIIIECKSEKTSPSSKDNGVEQLKSYMAACVNCEWGMWTNGKQKYVFQKCIDNGGNIVFQEYIDIPSANGDLDTINSPKRKSLVDASDDNLLFVFRTCHNYIHANDGLQKQDAFFEFLKIIFCKIEDERNDPHPLQFYTTSAERLNPDGQLTASNRVAKIFNELVKPKYGKIFEKDETIRLTPRSIAYIMGELQKYSLLTTNIDIKGKAYEEIVGANLRGDRGEFFTPRNVMKMVVEMINPGPDDKILDSSCGTGGFLVQALTHVFERLEFKYLEEYGPKSNWDDRVKESFRDKQKEIAKKNFYGFDINPVLVKATKMNMVMNNDGNGNVLPINSLVPPHEWNLETKKRLAEALGVDETALANHKSIGQFDIIVTNPPFGSKNPVEDRNTLDQYDLGRNAKKVPPEILFIERCTQFLKPGGRMGIVLPDSILGAPSLSHVRKWIMRHHKIIASIDLHEDTFQPGCGVQTSILVLQKKTPEEFQLELNNGCMADYDIFMAIIDSMGHDKRGNPVFKRDADGNVILFPETASHDDGIDRSREVKRLDDQTLDVPPAFREWKKAEGISW